MRKFFFVLASVGLFQQNAWAGGPAKMAHSHKASMGGAVVMSGDDHFEFLLGAQPGTIEVHSSDKFREPVAVKDFSNLKVTLVSGSEKVDLKIEADDQVICKFVVRLPKDVKAGSKLEVSGKRINAPKGYISGTSPQSIELSKVPKAKSGDDPHAAHHI